VLPDRSADQEDDVPTYAYACTACGHRFELQQSFSDASLTECPECEGRLRKLFNTVGIVFKGSGFYRTDSRAPAASGSSSTESAPKPAEKAPKPAETSSNPSSSGGSGESKSSAPAA
jgi:putative FmdB family regulatory protein